MVKDKISGYTIMKKISLIAAAVAMVAASASANAWWGNNWDDDFFGDTFGAGDFDFSFNMHARGDGYGRGYGRGYGYDYPYYGYAPYPAPVLTEEQQAALNEQQKVFAEQQQKAFEQAVAAQREYAKQFNADPATRMDTRMKAMQTRFDNMAPPRPELPEAFAKRMEESKAHRDEMIKEMEARRAEIEKQMEERRKVSMQRKPFEMPAIPARQDI
jgi:hypothetical protein